MAKQQKIVTSKNSSPKTNKNKVTVGRLKQVRDSLNQESSEKINAKLTMLNKSGNYSADKRNFMNNLTNSANSDRKRADKYDKIINKSTKKKK